MQSALVPITANAGNNCQLAKILFVPVFSQCCVELRCTVQYDVFGGLRSVMRERAFDEQVIC